ncbi:hypothetical protein J6590_104289 [Homalodisca vitripennis]|nr:hypothetical protein J6590_104289 [Homalodisca vitripennis]
MTVAEMVTMSCMSWVVLLLLLEVMADTLVEGQEGKVRIRAVITAPTRSCPDGQRRDFFGRCRNVFQAARYRICIRPPLVSLTVDQTLAMAGPWRLVVALVLVVVIVATLSEAKKSKGGRREGGGSSSVQRESRKDRGHGKEKKGEAIVTSKKKSAEKSEKRRHRGSISRRHRNRRGRKTTSTTTTQPLDLEPALITNHT